MIDSPTVAEEAPHSSELIRRGIAVFLAVAAGVLIYLLMLGRPVIRSDEAWFVWVAERMKHGDVLYRDVYFVSTPLAAWLGAAASIIGGTTIRTMRVVSIGIFVGSASTVWWTARRARMGLSGRLVLMAALVAYASPLAHFASIYSALAILFSLLAFAAALVWLERSVARSDPDPRVLSVAGIAIGLSIASKPNTGVLTLAALVVTLLVDEGFDLRSAAQQIRRVVVPVAAVVATMLIVIAATGALGAFAGDVLLEKTDYVRVMNRSLLSGFRSVLQILPGHGTYLVHAAARGRAPVFGTLALGSRYFETFRLVPLVSISILAWAFWRVRGSRDSRMVLCGAFFVAAWASAFPAPGPQHLAEVIPLIVAAVGTAVGVALSVPRTSRNPIRPSVLFVAAAAAWLAFGFLAITSRALDGFPGVGSVSSTLPHMQGVATDTSDVPTMQDVRALRTLTGGSVFIVRADAAFYYLAGNLRNPTPYDFAARSDFGAGGEEGVIHLFDHHRVRFACVSGGGPRVPSDFPDFRPLEVNRAVRARFREVARLRLCTLYEDPEWAVGPTHVAAARRQGRQGRQGRQ